MFRKRVDQIEVTMREDSGIEDLIFNLGNGLHRGWQRPWSDEAS
jgi:hypothetical protein